MDRRNRRGQHPAGGGQRLALNIREHREADAKLRQLAQRVVQSQEEERARLSRELHDGISQLLVSAKLVLEAAINRLRLAPAEGAAVAPVLGMALNRLDTVFNEVRRVARNLRPALLDDLGIFAALQHLAREMQGGSQLEITVAQSGTPRELSDEQATALYRFAQEALTNVERHARARKVAVSLSFDPDATRLTVRDDGRGFDVARMQVDPQRGIGLRNLRERIAALGGSSALSPASAAPNWWQCSRLRCLQPVPPPFPQNLRSHDPDT